MRQHTTTILHPTDFSPTSGLALRCAQSLARVAGARLVLLHVAQPPVVIFDERGNLLPRTADFRQAARDRLSSLAKTAEDGTAVEPRLAEGPVSAAILSTAEEVQADAIVMGMEVRSGLDRLIIPSAARDVMRAARCPVVTVAIPAGLSAAAFEDCASEAGNGRSHGKRNS